jgi:methyl-accepting chemotaxis protein
MSLQDRITKFLLKFTYSQKLLFIFFLTAFFCLVSGFGVWYSCTNLYKETLLNKKKFGFQVNVAKITNSLAAYQVEVIKQKNNPENFDNTLLFAIVRDMNKEIDDFVSSLQNYRSKIRSTVLQQQMEYHLDGLEEFLKLWGVYRKTALNLSLEKAEEKFNKLMQLMDTIQTNLRSFYRLYSNTDEGTKRLIDFNYILIPRLTIQIPVFYNLLQGITPPENSLKSDSKNADVYGFIYKLTEDMTKINLTLNGISDLIDDSLQSESQPLFRTLLEELQNVESDLITTLDSNEEIGSYNNARRALQTYSEAQEKINEILEKLYDLQATSMETRLYTSYIMVLFAGFFVLITYFTKIILQPVKELSNAADELAIGKVNIRIPVRFHDEVGEMTEGFNALASFLENKLKEIKSVSSNLLEAVHVILDVAKKLEANITIQDKELIVIKGYIKEITVVAKEFTLHLNNVYKSISATTGFADVGRKSLSEMEIVMQQMMGASNSIVNTLKTLNIKICSINDVINTIVKIADQINLLSLNTAIQANKAGPEGRGFTIIAKKTKELSGQTAYSTLDIEKTVREIIESVNFSVNEVNKFLEQVMLQVMDSTQLSEEFKKLIHFFQKQVEVFKSVSQDVAKQSESATELHEVLRTLSNASKKTTTSVNQFRREIESLHQSTTNLVKKIDSFTHPSYIELAISEDKSPDKAPK